MEIVNIVVSGSFNQKVNLHKLMTLGDIYTYDPEMYHGGYIRLSSATVTVYRSGKYIIPGIKSISMIEQLWDELVSILYTHVDTTLFDSPSIKNIVAKDDLGKALPLVKIQEVLCSEGAEYEPEVFPGLMWTTEYGSVNIFQSGKFLLLGCKNIEDLLKLDEFVSTKLKEIMSQHKIGTKPISYQ